jgi:hypothetical protein
MDLTQELPEVEWMGVLNSVAAHWLSDYKYVRKEL